MGMSNEEINPNKVGLNVMKSKDAKCVKRMPGGHCKNATGAPDCTYSYEEAGEILLDELAGIGDYDKFWNSSFEDCMTSLAEGKKDSCVHNREYMEYDQNGNYFDRGVGCNFW